MQCSPISRAVLYWVFLVNQKTMTTLFVYIVSRDNISMLLLLHLPLLGRGGKLLNGFVAFKWFGITRENSLKECFYDTTMDQAKVGRWGAWKCKILGRVLQRLVFRHQHVCLMALTIFNTQILHPSISFCFGWILDLEGGWIVEKVVRAPHSWSVPIRTEGQSVSVFSDIEVERWNCYILSGVSQSL